MPNEVRASDTDNPVETETARPESPASRSAETGSEIQPRIDPVYIITGDSNRTVTPGTYSSISVESPASSQNSPDIIIGAGNVTLTGGNGLLFNVPTGIYDKVQISSQTDPASLRLVQGEATGNIRLSISRPTAKYKTTRLFIGSGQNNNLPAKDLPTVTLNGNIDGPGVSYVQRYPAVKSIVETQGANLVVKGNISHNQTATMLSTLNAYNGNISTVSGSTTDITSPNKYDIYAYIASARSGFSISSDVDFAAAAVNLEKNSSIYANDRIDIMDPIGDPESASGGGSMAAGSKLEARRHVVLYKGIKQAAGLIKSDQRSILAHEPAHSQVEVALKPITQGGTDPLTLEAAQDILAADINVDTLNAGANIVAGSQTFRMGSPSDPSGALPGRIFLNAGGDGFFYPRYSITANNITAGQYVLAGEITLPKDKTASPELTASNIWVTKAPAGTENLPQYSGDLTMDGGTLKLTSPDNMQLYIGLDDTKTKLVTLDYPSMVEGDMKLTNNMSTSFTTLKVGETASVTNGNLQGTTLVANKADFGNLNSVTLKGNVPEGQKANLDINTDFTITGKGTNEINTAIVGGKSTISGGSYKGTDLETQTLKVSENAEAAIAHTKVEKDASITGGGFKGTDLTANSAIFTDTSITLTGDVPEGHKANLDIATDLTMTGNKQSEVTVSNIGGKADISGGSFAGDTLSAKSASFTSLSGVKLNDSLNVETGLTMTDSTASSIKSAIVSNGDAIIRGGFYGGGSLKANNIRFTNVSGVNISDSLETGGSLYLSGSGENKIAAATIDGNASINGGSYTGGSLTVGSADLNDISSFNLSNSLTSSGNILFSNSTASINGETGIGGSLTVSGGSISLRDTSVDNALSVSSGYLYAGEMTAKSASFKNYSSAEFDDLILKGEDLSLTVEGGSTVFINNALTDLKGIEAIQEGNLIIRGLNDKPTTITELYIDRDTALTHKHGIFNLTRGLYGGDESSISNAWFAQLEAGEIKITNTNLNLDGIGNFGNKVYKDLIIHKNGDSRLGDIKVYGNAEVTGGKIQASNLNVTGNANFEAVNLNLLGIGDNASSIGGNLAITRNAESNLGDIKVNGFSNFTGGILTAGSFSTGAATLSGSINANIQSLLITDKSGSLNIGAEGESRSSLVASSIDTGGTPINLYGDSSIQVNGNIPGTGNIIAGEINMPGSGYITASGDIIAQSFKYGETGTALAGANVTIVKPLTALKIGSITAIDGSVNLEGGAIGPEGEIAANHDIIGGKRDAYKGITGALDLMAGRDIDARDISVKKLNAGGNVTAHNGSVNLASGGEIMGNLTALGNMDSSLGDITVRGQTEFANGILKADSLVTGGASLDNLQATFTKLTLQNSSAASNELNVKNTGGNSGIVTIKGSLDLNGGTIITGQDSIAPAMLIVNQFANNSSTINGNIAVSKNGLLVLGAQNRALLETPSEINTGGNATFVLARAMTLDNRFGIHATGTGMPHPIANQIRFDAGSLLVIDADNRKKGIIYSYLGNIESLKPSAQLSETNGAIGALNAQNNMVTANVNNGAQIYIRNPKANTVIVALGKNISTIYSDQTTRAGNTESAPWTGANLDYDNKGQVKIKRLENEYSGQFLVLPADSHDNPDIPDQPAPPDKPAPPSPPAHPRPSNTHPNAHPSIHDAIDNGQNKGTIGNEEHHLVTDHGAGFISHTIVHNNPHEATRLVEGSSRMIILGGVPQLLLAANGAAESAMSDRTAITGLIMREDSLHAHGISLWAIPLYKTSTAWNLEAGNHDYDYNGGIGGIAVGGDLTFGDMIRAGLSFNIGGGYSKSGGNLPETTNNMNFWGVGAYAGWALGNFGIDADISFTSTYNKLKQDVSALNGWRDLKTDAQAYAISTGLNFEYLFRTPVLDIVPHAGFKYHHLHIYDYDITHNGNTIIDGESFSQNIWTFPAGVKLEKEFTLDSGLRLKPSLDLRVTPATGDIMAKTTTRYTRTDTDIELRTKVMDYIMLGGTLGLEAQYGNFTAGISYSLDAGNYTLSNGIFGTFRYEF